MKRLYLEDVRPLTYEQLRERREKVEYEKTRFYVNRFPSDVYIRDRSGLLTKIRPRISGSFERDCFFICENISCSPDMSRDYVQQARQTANSMRQHAHKVVLQQWQNELPTAVRYSVEAQCSLSLATLLQNDGVVYLEEHDIVVIYGLTDKEMEKIYHPYSIAGYTAKSLEYARQDNPHIRRGDFTFNIRIVDNYDQFGSHWILIDDVPFCIVACKDDEVTDGIYVTYSKNMLNGKGPKKLLVDRFDFTQSGNLPYYKLYENQQEALLARKSVQVEEAQAKIRELEAKTTAAENSLRKAQQERDNAEREAQHRRERHEQDMEKLRRDKEKLEREHELYMQKQVGEILAVHRKNTTELIKCVPVVLSTIACTIALFRKKD